MRKNSGFILLMALCMVLIISTLLIISLHHILLYHKALNRQESEHQNFYQLEYIGRKLAGTFKVTPVNRCIRKQDNANEALRLLTKGLGCSLAIGTIHYKYIMEDLGIFPCLVLYKKGQKYSTHHIRISLFSASEEHSVSLLQLRFLKPTTTGYCEGEEHIVNETISSWRYLSAPI